MEGDILILHDERLDADEIDRYLLWRAMFLEFIDDCHRVVTNLSSGCHGLCTSSLPMFVRICAALLLSGFLAVSALEDPNNLEQTKQTLEKWVQTRQLIGKTRSDWEADREVLNQTIKLFEKELATIEGEFAKEGGRSEQVEKEQAELIKEKELFQSSAERLQELMVSLESSVRHVSKLLPTPLRSRIDPLLEKMPADSVTTKMSALERMQIVVAVLSEIDKFNGSISVHSEIQKNGAGEDVQVKIFYLGLGQAYWVDKSGRAGTGTPGVGGWEWIEDSELAPRINQAIAIYESSQPAAFVSLPVTLN